jgi:MSHA biogenesis protein MshJ
MNKVVFKNEIILKIENRFNQSSIREKIFILVALLMVVYGGWYTLFYSHLLTEDAEISNKTRQVRQKINVLEEETSDALNMLHNDNTAALKQQIENLSKRNEELNKEIYKNTKGMVSAKDMNKILSELVQKSTDLTDLAIVKMESLQTKPLFVVPNAQENTKTKPLWVFKHGLKVEMCGDYLNTLQFLKKLEQQNLNIMWDALDYEVKKYPNANIIIVLHTLSLDEGWIDV